MIEESFARGLSAEAQEYIAQACLEFEEDLDCEGEPKIEEYLNRASKLAFADSAHDTSDGLGGGTCLLATLFASLVRIEFEKGLGTASILECQQRFDHPSFRQYLGGTNIRRLVKWVQLQATIPSKIGEFSVLGELGSGGFGRVFRARDSLLERDVAIKFPLPRSLSEGDRRRLAAEAKKLAKIKDPQRGVADVYHVMKDVDGDLFVVMELIEGRPLSNLAGQLPVRAAVEVVQSVAASCQRFHEMGLYHCDLKPSNIVLEQSRGNRPVIVDFGAAVYADELPYRDHALEGTSPYMSPEQIRCDLRSVTAATDVFSLGIILYELIAGTHPFCVRREDGKLDRAGTEEAILCREQRGLCEVNGSIPQDLSDIVNRCLQKTPNQRYDSGGKLAEALNEWLEDWKEESLSDVDYEDDRPFPHKSGDTEPVVRKRPVNLFSRSCWTAVILIILIMAYTLFVAISLYFSDQQTVYDYDPDVRFEIQELVAKLGSYDTQEKSNAADRLSQGGYYAFEALDRFGRLLGSTKVRDLAGLVRVRSEIIKAIGTDEGLEYVIAELSNSNEGVRLAASYALACAGEDAVPHLLTALKEGGAEQRVIAVVDALGQIGDERATEPLLGTLQEGGSDKRVIAVVDALQGIGDNRAREALLKALDEGGSDDRVIAIVGALRQIGFGEENVELLIALLREGGSDERLIAIIGALGEIGDRLATEALAKVVGNREQPKLVRCSAARSLSVSDPDLLIDLLASEEFDAGELVPAYSDTRPYNVRPEYGIPFVSRLVDRLGELDEPWQRYALQYASDRFLEFPNLLPALLAFLASPREETRHLETEVVGALRRYCDSSISWNIRDKEAAIQRLHIILQERTDETTISVMLCLEKFRDPDAVEHLLKKYVEVEGLGPEIIPEEKLPVIPEAVDLTAEDIISGCGRPPSREEQWLSLRAKIQTQILRALMSVGGLDTVERIHKTLETEVLDADANARLEQAAEYIENRLRNLKYDR